MRVREIAQVRRVHHVCCSAALVHVIPAKYLEHTPLYRQEQSFQQRDGVSISRKTMGGWFEHVAEQWLSISKKEGFLMVGCMAHVRRKFHEAWRDYGERSSGWYILRIGELYEITRELKQSPREDVVATRVAKSRPILKKIKEQLDADLLTLDPNSKSYKAVQYALNIWNNQCRYLDYPDATIDNNAPE